MGTVWQAISTSEVKAPSEIRSGRPGIKKTPLAYDITDRNRMRGEQRHRGPLPRLAERNFYGLRGSAAGDVAWPSGTAVARNGSGTLWSPWE